jgi:hypothetical protein
MKEVKMLKINCKKKVTPLHTKIARSIAKKKIVFKKPAKKPVIKPIC